MFREKKGVCDGEREMIRSNHINGTIHTIIYLFHRREPFQECVQCTMCKEWSHRSSSSRRWQQRSQPTCILA